MAHFANLLKNPNDHPKVTNMKGWKRQPDMPKVPIACQERFVAGLARRGFARCALDSVRSAWDQAESWLGVAYGYQSEIQRAVPHRRLVVVDIVQVTIRDLDDSLVDNVFVRPT